MVLIEPSILSADVLRLGEQAKEAEEAKADGLWLQIDVMTVDLTRTSALAQTWFGRYGMELGIIGLERMGEDETFIARDGREWQPGCAASLLR